MTRTASQNTVFGDMPTRVSLDAALARVWQPPLARTTITPAMEVELVASTAFHSKVRWFSDPDGNDPDELVGRGCHLRLATEMVPERVSGTCQPTGTGIRHALRFATQPALLRRGWLLLHACAVELSDGVHAFAGASGSGKSTFARRAAKAGHRVLAEELLLVTVRRAAAHPAEPLVTETASKPLGAIHFIEHGDPTRRRLTPGQACARLLSLAMVYERSNEAARLALSAALPIVESCPAFATTISDDDRALSVLRKAPR